MAELEVRHIMSTDLVTLDRDEVLGLADTIMSLARIRHLPVVADERLVGLITHRDLLRAQAEICRKLKPGEDQDDAVLSVRAGDIMIHGIETVTPHTPALEAARVIYDQKIGCLPVLEAEALVGIVTEADFVRLVIEGLEDIQAHRSEAEASRASSRVGSRRPDGSSGTA